MKQHIDCREIERMVWTEGPEEVPQAHIDECPSCRMEARQAADLRAALSGLQAHLAEAPESLEEAVLAAVQQSRIEWARQVVTHPRFWRGAAVGAATAAAATAATLGVILARRRIAARVSAAA